MKQPITIGRIVHYVSLDGSESPAIIVNTNGNKHSIPGATVNLQVFGDREDAITWKQFVGYSDKPTAGAWHWPETEKAVSAPAKRGTNK